MGDADGRATARMTAAARRAGTVLACVACATAIRSARGDDFEALGGDRVTGTFALAGEVAPVVIDVPQGAVLRARVRRSGKGTLLPVLSLRRPNGADAADLFTTRPRRGGAEVSGLVASVPEGGRWTIDVGAGAGTGTWVLTVDVVQARVAPADLDVPAAGVATGSFHALAGSRATLTATHRDGPAAPRFDAVRGPGGPLDLGAAVLRVKGRRTTLVPPALGATGAHDADVSLTGGGAGDVSFTVRLKSPRPRHARLTHPGPAVPDALRITTSSLAAARVGVEYTATLSAAGGTPARTFSVTAGSLPDGIELAADGTISGTADVAGSFAFTATVTDSAAPPATASRELRLVVTDGGPGTPAWAILTPGGAAPAGRSSPGFVLDPHNGRLLVALGSTGSSGFPPVRSDTVALTLGASPAWTALGTGPRARWGPSLVADTARQRAILYGGNVDGYQTNGEVWALDCSVPTGGWTQLAPSGGPPAARLSHVAVHDTANDRMIVFGGGSGTVPGNASRADVWELSFATSAQGVWTERTPAGGPSAREFSAGVFDPVARRLVLFGGMTMGTQFGDTWALDLTTPGAESWTQLSPGGTVPAARDEHTAVLDAKHGRMIVFGGLAGASDTAEAWALDLTAGAESWSLLTPTGAAPAARDSHAAVYDPAGERMIVFSGFTGFPSTPFTDVWELRLP